MDRPHDLRLHLPAVAHLYTRRFEERARTLSLQLVQSKVLIMLAENEGASQKQLSDITEIAPVRLGRILNRMEAAGWMERRRHPADGRVRLLAVTENAEPVLRLIQTIIHKTYVEALQGLSTDEIAFMVEALECVHSNLSACEPVGADL